MPTDPIDQAIADAVVAPKRSTGDNGSIEEHSLPDLIAAAEYLERRKRNGRFRISKFSPGGAP